MPQVLTIHQLPYTEMTLAALIQAILEGRAVVWDKQTKQMVRPGLSEDDEIALRKIVSGRPAIAA